jgi:hypothetical protein
MWEPYQHVHTERLTKAPTILRVFVVFLSPSDIRSLEVTTDSSRIPYYLSIMRHTLPVEGFVPKTILTLLWGQPSALSETIFALVILWVYAVNSKPV